ncbi:MAG: hypothetical protein ACOC8A_01350 [bacterium]
MRRFHLFSLCFLMVASATAARADAVTRAADRLVADQATDGSWPGDEGYTGSIVAGLVHAYEMTGTAAYRTSAEDGGDYILASASGNFYGDEAYGLTRLSDIAPDPQDNTWRTEVADFYQRLEDATGGTQGYIDDLVAGSEDISIAVFYLAHHTLAAYYVDATDKGLWRTAVIDNLGLVTDDAYYPVMALGLAVWALARTGPMDATLVDPDAPADSPWYLKTLADLPPMLASHQDTTTDYAGSFYWRFDHTGPGGYASGYTEDTAFGALGLLASHDAGLGDYAAAIADARDALELGVNAAGEVYEHIWEGTYLYYAYAGETLQVILHEPTSLNPPGPLDIDEAPMADGGLNPTGPAPRSLTILGIDPNGNPPSTLYAIQVGTAPDAGWLVFVNSGDPLFRDDLYPTGEAPDWHLGSDWADKRLRGLSPSTSYTFHAKAKNDTEQTDLVEVGTYTTNADADTDRSGAVSVLDLVFTRDASLSDDDIGTTGKPWATDADDSGDTTAGDIDLVRDRILAAE